MNVTSCKEKNGSNSLVETLSVSQSRSVKPNKVGIGGKMQKHENVICSRIEYEGEGQGKEKLIKIVDIVARY